MPRTSFLQELWKNGRLKVSPWLDERVRGRLRDPMSKFKYNHEAFGRSLLPLDPTVPTPDRVMYQQGLRNQYDRELRRRLDAEAYFDEQADAAQEALDSYGDEYPYNTEFEAAASEWENANNELTDWQRNGMQRLQTQSPRYRNYQRVLQQKRDNLILGRELRRYFASEVKRLVDWGYTPEAAYNIVREFFRGE